MRVKRQWMNRPRTAHLTSAQCQRVQDGRSPTSKSARRPSVTPGVSVEDVYGLRLAVAVAGAAICHTAIQAIDSKGILCRARAARTHTLREHRKSPHPPHRALSHEPALRVVMENGITLYKICHEDEHRKAA
ncbi:hypothetical protein [Cupriavidus lacunae]|uniref:hypothetical protein n=1 Tax=Cupriavidus lacunae TaxID=2666307 RepID=UPI0011AE9B7A|nr:hypothetical protein [Cupriavidus lacunae]